MNVSAIIMRNYIQNGLKMAAFFVFVIFHHFMLNKLKQYLFLIMNFHFELQIDAILFICFVLLYYIVNRYCRCLTYIISEPND